MQVRIASTTALNRNVVIPFNPEPRRIIGGSGSSEGPMTVWIYVNTVNQAGDPGHLKVFANRDAAEAWLAVNDPEGVAFECEVEGRTMSRRDDKRGLTWWNAHIAELHYARKHLTYWPILLAIALFLFLIIWSGW
jgi:hypothetical protein